MYKYILIQLNPARRHTKAIQQSHVHCRSQILIMKAASGLIENMRQKNMSSFLSEIL